MTYVCPMHPEVKQDTPGTCPKCGMKLVVKSEHEDIAYHKSTLKDYAPLVVIIGLIFLTTLVVSYKEYQIGDFYLSRSIAYFMSGFFLIFSGFKLMDLRSFAEGYKTYDLVAKRFPVYAYLYPFIELFFGLSMAAQYNLKWILLGELVVMFVSGWGVARKLAKKEKFQCACLGKFLKVPLTKVTLIKDFGMAFLALLMLFLR